MAKNPAKTPPKSLTPDLLRKRLNNAERVALLAIGSRLRGDDAAGLLVADTLEKKHLPDGRFRIFIGDTAPENVTGAVKRFRPGHIILVDAADFGGEPGSVRLIEPEEAQGVCFCTHQIPLQVLADYLVKSIGDCCVTIIGIQAGSLGFSAPLHKEVTAAARDVAGVIAASL
jgi:hydrogenase 3 maturation protease